MRAVQEKPRKEDCRPIQKGIECQVKECDVYPIQTWEPTEAL